MQNKVMITDSTKSCNFFTCNFEFWHKSKQVHNALCWLAHWKHNFLGHPHYEYLIGVIHFSCYTPWQVTDIISCLLTPFNSPFTIIPLDTVIYNISTTFIYATEIVINVLVVLYQSSVHKSELKFSSFIRPKRKLSSKNWKACFSRSN